MSFLQDILVANKERTLITSVVSSVWGFLLCLGTMKTVMLKCLKYDDLMKKVVK